MSIESEQLWGTIRTLGADDGEPLSPASIYRQIDLGIVEMGDDAPRLTAYGEKCFVILESGDGEVPELDVEY